MAFSVRAEIDVRDVIAALRTLRGKGTRILRKGVDEASKPILATARALVRVATGLTRKSLGKKMKTYTRSFTVVAIVGPRKGFKREVIPGFRGQRKLIKPGVGTVRGRMRDPVNTAHLVEGGTKPHSVGAGLSSRKGIQGGRMHPGAQAYPFIGPALKQNVGPAAATIRRVAAEELEREAQKAKRV